MHFEDDKSSSSDEYPEPGEVTAIPDHPLRRTRSGHSYHAGQQYHPVTSRMLSHIQVIEDLNNVIYATLDWENVKANTMYQRLDCLFAMHMDPTTKQFLNPNMIHPFYMYPLFAHIFAYVLRLPKSQSLPTNYHTTTIS